MDWIVFRVAELYLNYAEALNEYYETPPKEAFDAVLKVRERSGMPGFPSTLNKEQFREKLRRERAVELAYEDHRFWDVRRWKIADTTQRELYGVKIEKQADGTFNFYKNLYETRNWRDCMYLYPIPQSELYKNTNLNPQNTGW